MFRCSFRNVLVCSALLLASLVPAPAATTTLFLLNGTVLRGEIISRTPRVVQLQTTSGLIRVKTANLMPISRQQLKLPAEVEKDIIDPDMDVVLAQLEKLVAENEALKLEVASLKAQIAKSGASPTPEASSSKTPPPVNP